MRAVKLVRDKEGKPRGYAFVEYDTSAAMREAYKRGDGTRVRGRRALVDVERGRTIEGWRPRRLGGGLGKTRANKEPRPVGAKRGRSPERADYARQPERRRSRSRSRDRRRDRSRSRDRGDRRKRDWK